MVGTDSDASPQDRDLWSEFKYKAFISYARLDKRVGAEIHRKIEQFRIPRALRKKVTKLGPVPSRISPIYRDLTDMDAHGGLSETIRTALERSAFLIVVCSPTAAKSKWVNREIETFASLGRTDQIIPIIVDGRPRRFDPATSPEGAFPPALYDAMRVEDETSPVAPDIRRHAEGMDYAILKTCAAIVGVAPGELSQRVAESERRQKRIQRRIASVMFGLAAIAAATSYIALTKLFESEVRRSIALAGQAQQAFLDERFDFAALTALAALPDPHATVSAPSTDEAEFVFRRASYFNRLVAAAPATGSRLHSAAASPANDYIATGDQDGRVVLRRATDFDPVAELEKPVCADTARDCLVSTLAFSPDGKLLAAISRDEKVHLWSVDTQEILAVLDNAGPPRSIQTPDGPVTVVTRLISDIAFSPDSAALAMASWDGRVRVFSTADGAETTTIDLGPHAVNKIAYAPDGKHIAVAADGLLDVRSTLDGVTIPIADAIADTNVVDVAYSPDGSLLAVATHSGDGPGEVLLLSTQDYTKMMSVATDSKPKTIRFSNDSAQIFIADEEDAAQIHDLASASLAWKTATPYAARIVDAAFTADNKFVATIGVDGRIALRDFETGIERWTWRSTRGSVYATAFLNGGANIVTAGEDGVLSLWKNYPWNASETLAQSDCAGRTPVGDENICPVANMQFSPNGREFSFLSADRTLHRYDAIVNQPLSTSHAEFDVGAFAYIDDNSILLSSTDGGIFVADLTSPGAIATVNDKVATYGAWRSDREKSLFAGYGDDGRLVLFAPGQKPSIRTLADGSGAPICAFDISKDGRAIATLATSGEIAIYDTETLSRIFSKTTVASGCLNRPQLILNDGQTMLVAASEKVLTVWNVEDGLLINDIETPTRVDDIFLREKDDLIVFSRAFSGDIYVLEATAGAKPRSFASHAASTSIHNRGDGQLFVSAGYGGINIWDEKTLGFIAAQTIFDNISSVAFSPIDNIALVGTQGGAVLKIKTPYWESGKALSRRGCAEMPKNRTFTELELDDPMLRRLLNQSEVRLCN